MRTLAGEVGAIKVRFSVFASEVDADDAALVRHLCSMLQAVLLGFGCRPDVDSLCQGPDADNP